MTFIFIFIFKNKKHFLAKYLSSVFFIVLFTQNFEVTFSQNNIALSLLFWILLGLGLGYFIRDKYEFTDSSSSKVMCILCVGVMLLIKWGIKFIWHPSIKK